MPLSQGTVGPIIGQDGALLPSGLRQGRLADLIVSELHGRYFETAFRKNKFLSATQAGQTTSAGLATTYVGLCLSNPIGSPVNLVLTKVGFLWTVIAAAVTGVGLAVGFSATTNVVHTTPVTPRSTLVGTGPTPNGLTDTAATLPVAPTYAMFFGDTPTATTNPNGGVVDLEGSIILPPGGFAATVTTVASSAAAFFASIMWEEVPTP